MTVHEFFNTTAVREIDSHSYSTDVWGDDLDWQKYDYYD